MINRKHKQKETILCVSDVDFSKRKKKKKHVRKSNHTGKEKKERSEEIEITIVQIFFFLFFSRESVLLKISHSFLSIWKAKKMISNSLLTK